MAEDQDPFAEFGGKTIKPKQKTTEQDPFAEFGGKTLKKKGQSVESSTSSSVSNNSSPISSPTYDPNIIPQFAGADPTIGATQLEDVNITAPALKKTYPLLNPNAGYDAVLTKEQQAQALQPKAPTEAEIAMSNRLAQIKNVYDTANPNINKGVKAEETVTKTIPDSERAGNRATYLYNKVLEGVGSTLSGLGDLAVQGASVMNTGVLDASPVTRKLYRENIAPSIRTYLKDTVGAKTDKGLEARYNNETITSALGGVFNSAPAMLTTAASGGVGTMAMFAQSFDNAIESINQSEEGRNLDEATKSFFAGGVGIATALLEKYSFDKIFKGETGLIGNAIAKRALRNASEETGGKVTGDVFGKFLDKEIIDLTNKYVKGGARLLDASLVEYATEASQEAVQAGAELLVNKETGKPVFDTSETSKWNGFLNRINKAGVAGAIGGVFMGGLSMGISNLAGVKTSVVEESQSRLDDINKALENENISDAAKEVLVQEKIKIQDEAQKIANKVDEAYAKLDDKQKERVNEIVEEKAKLQEVLADENIPESIKENITKQDEDLTKELSEIKPVEEPKSTETTETSNIEKEVVSEGKNDYSSKSDKELNDRINYLEDKLGSGNENYVQNKQEFNSIEKELEKREWQSVIYESPEKALKTLKSLENNEYAFIEKRDIIESKGIIEKYKNPSKLDDVEIKNDFKEALFGNPTNWYADALKLKYAVQESINRGFSDKDLIKYAESEFIKDGYSKEEAKQTVASMLKPIFENNKSVKSSINEVKLTETPSTSKESIVQPLNTQESVSRVYESDNKIKEVGTEEEFKAYSDSIFPESKIKDVVYHGTNNEFKTFEKGHTDAKNSKTDTQGIHFIDEGSTKEYGDNYGRMVPAKLNFKNPLEIEATRENADMVERLEYLSQKDMDGFKKQGYDSAIIKRGNETEYIAFEPEQVINLSDIDRFKTWKGRNDEIGKSLREFARTMGIDLKNLPSAKGFENNYAANTDFKKLKRESKPVSSLKDFVKSNSFFINETQKQLFDRILESEPDIYIKSIKDDGVAGFSSVGDRNIYILNELMGTGKVSTVLHEAIHAVTTSAMYKGLDGKLTKPSDIKFYNEINDIYNQYKKLVSKKERAEYGFINVLEFMSEASSNSGFQRILSKYEINRKLDTNGIYNNDKTNLFKEIVNAISRFFLNNNFFKNQSASEKYINDVIYEIMLINRNVINNKEYTNTFPNVLKKDRDNDAGQNLIDIYSKNGIYKFEDIVKDAYSRFGEPINNVIGDLKLSYNDFYKKASSDIKKLMTTPQEVDNYSNEKVKDNEQNLKNDNTQEAQKPKETTAEAGKESVTKRFTLKDLKDISDGSGLVRKGEEFTNTEKLTSKLKKGDKIKFFAERERTGIYNGKAIIDDKGNQWGILAILTDKNGWIEVQSETIKNEKQNNNIDKQTKESITGITQEATAKARKAMGIEAYEKTSQSNEQRRAKAEKAIKDGYNVKQLIQNIKNSEDFVPSRQEMEILKIYDNSLEAAFNKNPTTELLAERADLLRTVDIGTSRAGAALQAVAGVEASVDNLANFLQAEAVHYGVDELPQNIIDDLKGKYEKGQEAKRAYEEGYQKAKDELIKQQAEAELAKQRKKSKSSVKKSSADYASERAELKQSIKDKLKKARGQLNAVPVPYLNELIAIAPDVAKLVRSYVEEGISKLDDIVKKVHSDLKDDIDGITEQDVIDLISGQYNPKRPTKTEILSQVRDLREQAKLLKKIEDLENGKIPNDPVKQVRRNAELEALRKQIKELEDEVGITEQRTLKSRRTALDNKIKQLQDDLATGNFDLEPAEPRRVRLDAETQKKQDEYIAFLKETNRRRDQAVYEQQSKITKAWLKFQQVLGLRRLIQTSIDFSMPFRQAVTVTLNPRYFRTTLESFGNMFKSTVSEKKYDRIMFAIQQDPLYNDMRADGLMFSEVDSKDNLKREEDYRTSFLYKIPYLREPFLASNRAAAGYINTARYNLYLKGVERLRAQGITHENSPENYAALAKWTMNMTGRGNLLDFMEKGENASKWQRIMGDTFYGTRLMASRFNMLNPNYYIKMPKEQRIEALKDIGSYVALSGMVALGAIGAGAKVSLDPEDADFLKAKWGDKRYDIFSGGMNTYLRTAYRLMKAILQRTNPKLYGENKDKAALKKANKYGSFAVKSGTDFFRYKLAPNTSYVLSGTLGKDPLGRDFNPTDILRFYPMYGDDLYSSWQKGEGGLEMLSILAPSLFGIGVQEYSNKKKPTKEKE